MNYEIIKLSAQEISPEIINKLSFWANPILLESFAKRDELKYYYLCVIEHNKVVAAMPVFEKRKYGFKYIVQPYEYYYTPIDFFMSENLSLFRKQNHQLLILKALAHFLKKDFLKINIHTEIILHDIRAFKWAGFRINILYTYIKKINEHRSESLPKENRRLLKNKGKKELYISEYWNLDIYKELSKLMLNVKKRPLRQIQENYFPFLTDLHEKGLCSKYVVFKEHEPLAYLIVLFDQHKKIIYAFYSALKEVGKKKGANIFCFDYMLNTHHDYHTFDFTGANVENIAFFKSQFNCNLVSYFGISSRGIDKIIKKY